MSLRRRLLLLGAWRAYLHAMAEATPHGDPEAPRTLTWTGRLALLLFVGVAIIVIWFTNVFLTERYTILTRNRAEVRQALYAGNLLSELQRNSIVPLLLSRDPVLAGALSGDDFPRHRST